MPCSIRLFLQRVIKIRKEVRVFIASISCLETRSTDIAEFVFVFKYSLRLIQGELGRGGILRCVSCATPGSLQISKLHLYVQKWCTTCSPPSNNALIYYETSTHLSCITPTPYDLLRDAITRKRGGYDRVSFNGFCWRLYVIVRPRVPKAHGDATGAGGSGERSIVDSAVRGRTRFMICVACRRIGQRVV